MTTSKLIVGLGNPGDKYEYTRHNLGFLVLKHFAEVCGVSFKKDQDVQGLIGRGEIQNQSVILLMPLTYMNLSGSAVKKLVERKEIAPENVLVVADDLHLEFGQLRIRPEGTDGGHNGLTSIIEQLGTANFPRLRLGIGLPVQKEETVDYVLGEFTKEEKKALKVFIEEAGSCIAVWTAEGIQKVMNQFNKRKGNE